MTKDLLLIGLVSLLTVNNIAAAAPRSGSLGEASLAKKKPADPPCSVTPDLSLLEESGFQPDQQTLVSAAWLARAVQLEDELRAQAWKKLPESPKLIRDLYAGPFGLHATVLEFEHSILIMYRGTQDPLDYVLNAMIFTSAGWIHGLPGWVHNGFLTNFGLTWRQLRNTLHQINADRKKNLVFASHSLGGVMSQYAAWRLENDGFRISRIFAFQSPNAGDRKFKERFDDRFSGRAINILYGDDITPFIPPSRSAVRDFSAATTRPLAGALSLVARKANYEALNGRFSVKSDGEVTESTAAAEQMFWQNYKSKTGGRGFPLGLSAASGFVSDHNIDRVVCALANSPAQD
jgi:hypothetical protein